MSNSPTQGTGPLKQILAYENSKLAREKAALEVEVKQVTAARDGLEASIRQYQDARRLAEESRNQAQAKLSEAQARILELEGEVEGLRAEVANLTERLCKVERDEADCLERYKLMQEQNALLEERLRAVELECRRLEVDNTRLTRLEEERDRTERRRVLNLLRRSFVTALEKRLNMIIAINRRDMPAEARDLDDFDGTISQFCRKRGLHWRDYNELVDRFASSRVVDRLCLTRQTLVNSGNDDAHPPFAPAVARELLEEYVQSLPAADADVVRGDLQSFIDLFDAVNAELRLRAGNLSPAQRAAIVGAIDSADNLFCDVWTALGRVL